MKKLAFFLVIISVVALSGCSNKQSGNSEAASKNTKIEDFAMRRPDFGQPDREADIRGLVSAMTGNEVDVLKIERPQTGEGGERINTEMFNDEQVNQEERGDSGTALSMGATGGRMPGMGPGGGMRREGEMDEEMQAQMLEKMKEMSTGEESITIPVGIQMLKPSGEGNKMEMVEATLNDIEENGMIEIWLNQDVVDRNVAEFILIMN